MSPFLLLDLALFLKAGARLDEALELLATDIDIGRLRSTIAKIRSSVLSGESFADALSRHTALFSPMYVALVRIGETSGKLERILELLASERNRAEALRRKLADALRYPAFLLFAASCVLVFFLIIRDAAIWRRTSRFRRQARSGCVCLPWPLASS